jgi:hypothetical protein
MAHASSLSPRIAPEFVRELVALIKQGRREGRALAAPVARQQQEKLAAVTTGLAEHPTLPARWFIGLYALSLGTGSLAPSPKQFVIAGLASAPGCQDHATSPSHLIRSSARENPRCDQTRPPHPAPDVRDDREAPLV